MILSLAGNSLANNLCCDSTTSNMYCSAEILSSHSHWPFSFTILLANSMIIFLVGNSSADDLCCGPVDSITSNMFSSQSYRPLRLWSCSDFINIQASDSCDGPWKVVPSPPPSAPPFLHHFYVLLVSSVSSDQFPVFSSLPSKFAAFFCKQVFASVYCTILTISWWILKICWPRWPINFLLSSNDLKQRLFVWPLHVTELTVKIVQYTFLTIFP